MFRFLDTQLNCGMLYALLHGILTVTLWSICEPGALHSDLQAEVNCTVINKLWPIRRALVLVIILLYILITASLLWVGHLCILRSSETVKVCGPYI
ncbi:hypothetical protein ARMGADRAFT_778577 [Armillaria gallica]|uniref:Uncharacterized protein n=1 Tax=Armillaria gallica TaxID=47427 RepID=A0A2H3D1V8_ARMGA|nr:hypothetical protein ARMGADRAFT_778577 [Armillaria gallica]